MLTKYINIQVFIISFVIGLFFVYILGPETKIIYMYPTPSNYKNTQYKDNTDQCFSFKPTEEHCPINPFDVKTIPVQAS